MGSGANLTVHYPVTQLGAAVCPVTLASTASSLLSGAGQGANFLLTAASGCSWVASSGVPWITVATSSGSGSGTVSYAVSANTGAARSGILGVGGQSYFVHQAAACAVMVSASDGSVPASGGTGSFSITAGAGCPWSVTAADVPWLELTSPAAGSGDGSITYLAQPNTGRARSGVLTVAGQALTVSQASGLPARFVPVRPCRVADTREPSPLFGGPALAAGGVRVFAIPQSACGIPAGVQAYALNVTVVPAGSLGYLTIWPAGQSRPLASTLNSPAGRIVANAAVVAAGSNGAVAVYATEATHLVLDINGYFTDSDPAALSFYALPPCRVFDSRSSSSSGGGVGLPWLFGEMVRDVPILSSNCGVLAAAQAYSLNATVVPRTALGYLTLWPAGQSRPLASILNSPTGVIVANAALVPAGNGGALFAFAAGDTDLVLDIDGQFAPAGLPNGLSFYAVPPCRALDTRSSIGGPLAAGVSRSLLVAGTCGIPATARAVLVNATVVPLGPLGFLTLAPAGVPLPFVSTLNSPDGLVAANLAIVPVAGSGAGGGNAIQAYATQATHLILDVNGYFAP
jgi:hypothetical protein